MLAPRLERVSECRLQQTVVANAVKTLRQDVDEKTPDELVCCERHCRVLAFGPIVMPPPQEGVDLSPGELSKAQRPDWLTKTGISKDK
jgi:hypothetical protein